MTSQYTLNAEDLREDIRRKFTAWREGMNEMPLLKDYHFKFLGPNGECWIRWGQWHLPHGRLPAEWMPVIKELLKPCQNGYHLARKEHLIEWIGPTLFVAEYRGDPVESDFKIVVPEARLSFQVEIWNDDTARLFATDCAERVLQFYDSLFKGDSRPLDSIQAARGLISGDMKEKEMVEARDRCAVAAREVIRSSGGDPEVALAWGAARAAAWCASGREAWHAAARASRFAAACKAFEEVRYDSGEMLRRQGPLVISGLASRDPELGFALGPEGDSERAWQTERLWRYLNGQS